MAKPFVINKHGRLVFPSTFQGDLDFSALSSESQLNAVVQRDFESKAPTGTELKERAESGAYSTKYALLRDIAQYLYWSNRFGVSMYEKRPTRWRDVPRGRDGIYIPVLTPWEDGAAKVAAIDAVFSSLPPRWDDAAEDQIHALLSDVFAHKLHHASGLRALKPTVAEFLEQPDAQTYCLSDHDPDYPVFRYDEILDCEQEVPELEALQRMAMVLHNQYPWKRAEARLATADEIDDDDFVVLYIPQSLEVQGFINTARSGVAADPVQRRAPAACVKPEVSVPPVIVADRFDTLPKIEALTAVKGEHVCMNADVVRNSAFSWSPMSADDISRKTGIEARRYTSERLEVLALAAASEALEVSGREADEIGSVIFCSCTSTLLLPSVATWLSGQLGMFQTHASFDLVAACAGFPYGLAEGVRIMQDTQRPALVVFGEKFSDKIGSVRTSRMIFGDGASAIVLAPAPEGEPSDIEMLQTYASGPVSQVNSIIWPNPEFDNDLTVWGPEVKALVERYLHQMMAELSEYPNPDGGGGTMVDAIDLVVPHQANRTMVIEYATQAGLTEESLYFNIASVGNMSAASIPIAICDAVSEGAIDGTMRVFAPGFGAGAVAGYAILRIDPSVVSEAEPFKSNGVRVVGEPLAATSPDNVRQAFG